MSERKRDYFFDPEAKRRYDYVVGVGKDLFTESGLVIPGRQITEGDLKLIHNFHDAVAPTNPANPWRLQREERPVAKDPSFYANWELPGGPLEHINLAQASAGKITEILQANLRKKPKRNFSRIINLIRIIDPYFVAAGAGLHDEGREVTHTYYTNEKIGEILLTKMGIRPDLIGIMPDEQIMLTPPDKDMNMVINRLSPEEVIVRLADEFGKRVPGTNRLYNPKDYSAWDRKKWMNGYLNKPDSGRPSERWMRRQMPLHVENVPRYFGALDKWVQSVSDLSLEQLVTMSNTELAPTLRPLDS
jgi:hypothetical protein